MNTQLNVAELEFDVIKRNLKDFLRTQPQFSDFDFDGSNMSVLLDVLAYNTHYNAMYLNMALNEMYLDSASRRNSVVSLAKSIGYLPSSARSAQAVLNLTYSVPPAEDENFLTLQKNTPFQAQKDGQTFLFYTTEANNAVREAENRFVFRDVVLIEGVPSSNVFVHSEENRYALKSEFIDLSTLVVKVQPNATSTNFVFMRNGNTLVDVNSQSNVFFINEIDDGFYQISFGDGILGRRLDVGSIITVEYFVSSRGAPNGIRTLSWAGGPDAFSPFITGGTVQNIQLRQPISGGAEPEHIERIRTNAPKTWLTQNRAVTAEDYRSIILNNYPAIRDIKVWGGENNIPPVYGKLFLSATGADGIPLSEGQKTDVIRNIIDKYKVVTVIPEFVDPAYIDVELDVVVYYNQALTAKTPNDMRANILQSILRFNDLKLKNFDSVFRNLEIIQAIEQTDISITNVIPRLRLFYEIRPVIIGKYYNYKFELDIPLSKRESSVLTNSFRSTRDPSRAMFINNTEEGLLNMFFLENNQRRIVGAPVGKVNFEHGRIEIDDVNILMLLQPRWTVQLTPETPDVVGHANNIVRIDQTKIKIHLKTDKINPNDYQFASSTI